MQTRSRILLGLASLLAIGSLPQTIYAAPPDGALPAKSSPATVFEQKVIPFLKSHCLECHGVDLQEGDIRFDQPIVSSKLAADESHWRHVMDMLRSGAMPPEDSPQPTESQRRAIVQAIEKAVYQLDCDNVVDPGRVTIRRLNRTEYNNTVRDLLGIHFRPADDFPSDDVGGGFDNIGDVLTLSPLLMEKYLAAAERIAEELIVTDPSAFVRTQFKFRDQLRGEGSADYDATQNARRWSLEAADGSVWADYEIATPGRYNLQVVARGNPVGDVAPQMEMQLDGRAIQVFDVTATEQRGRYEMQCEILTTGTHRVSVRLLNPFRDESLEDARRQRRSLIIDSMEVNGPLVAGPDDYPEAHRKLLPNSPSESMAVIDTARLNLQPLLERAFRRPVASNELDQFSNLVDNAVKAGDSFEQGMQAALTAVLVSPHFLFRIEDAHPSAIARDLPQIDSSPFVIRPLSDYHLATRLSYFLWSSMPDDELFALAAAGRLHEPNVLSQQVRRMLSDHKSDALVQNFVTQWLNLRLLESLMPDPQVFPGFDEPLKVAMRRETELFATAIVREDRSVLEFLTGRFSFVNQRLAEHYGIPGVQGPEFQRVTFTDDRRTGVLTHASILALTSNPGRTSPVKRGKWILDNILGSPPPDPPPDVPELESTQKSQPNLSLRKQLEIHRQNAVCASCHKVMDQLGFGLENFNALGQWRDRDGEFAIDPTGELPGGSKFRGPLQLAKVLDRRRAEFVRCLAEKMLTFALGRELRVQDRCAVDKIVEQVESQDYRFASLVTAIAASDPFQLTRVEGELP